MKIISYFTGAIRNSIDEIKENILEFKKNFINYDVDYYLITYESDNKISYDKNELENKLFGVVNIIYKISPDKEFIETCKNNCSIIEFGFDKYMHDYIIENKLTCDYFVKCRNDVFLKLNNVDKYINENTCVLPRIWWNLVPNALSNNHFFIIPYLKFININYSFYNINLLAKESWDCEAVNVKLVNPNAVINFENVIEYKINGGLKFHIKNNVIIQKNAPITIFN